MTRPRAASRGARVVHMRTVLALTAHPTLWATAARQLVVLARPRWWAGPPFLPLPDRAYLEFRLQTMYGDPAHVGEPEDLLTYLRWCRSWPEVNH